MATQCHVKLRSRYTFLLFLFAALISRSQDKAGPTALFSFNNRNMDEISGSPPRSGKSQFTEERFGNSNYAMRLFGNDESYINLGNYAALKPKTGSISLWIRMEGMLYSGQGNLFNPILFTKNSNSDDFCEAYAIYYSLERQRIEAVLSNDSLKQVNVSALEKTSQFRWYHVVLTYDDDYASFYLDGRLQSSFGKGFESYFQ